MTKNLLLVLLIVLVKGLTFFRKSVVGLLGEWRRKGMNGKKNGMIRAFFPANTSDFFYSSNPTSTASFNCSLNGVLGC